MKILKFIPIWLFATLVLVSCGEDAGVEMESMEFNGLEVSKEMVFTDEVINLALDASGYSEVELTSNKPTAIEFNRIARGKYEISSDVSVIGKVYVALKDANGEYSDEVKTVNVGFFEHGVVNYNVVEGIKINTDKSDKILALLGEPFDVVQFEGTVFDRWIYPSKGLYFFVDKSTKVVEQVNISSSIFAHTKDNVETRYTTYTYDLPNGWKMGQSTMSSVVDEFGSPTEKYGFDEIGIRGYLYNSLRTVVYFRSQSEDDYFGKNIVEWAIF